MNPVRKNQGKVGLEMCENAPVTQQMTVKSTHSIQEITLMAMVGEEYWSAFFREISAREKNNAADRAARIASEEVMVYVRRDFRTIDGLHAFA